MIEIGYCGYLNSVRIYTSIIIISGSLLFNYYSPPLVGRQFSGCADDINIGAYMGQASLQVAVRRLRRAHILIEYEYTF